MNKCKNCDTDVEEKFIPVITYDVNDKKKQLFTLNVCKDCLTKSKPW